MELENGWSMSATQRRTELRRLAAIKRRVPADWEVVINPRLTDTHAQMKHAKKRLELSHRLLVRDWEENKESFFACLPKWIVKNQKLPKEREVKVLEGAHLRFVSDEERAEDNASDCHTSIQQRRINTVKKLIPDGWEVILNPRLKSTLVHATHDLRRMEVSKDFLGDDWDLDGLKKRLKKWNLASQETLSPKLQLFLAELRKRKEPASEEVVDKLAAKHWLCESDLKLAKQLLFIS